MQKILRYELTVATKGRSKAFRLLTLALFSFSLTVVVISFLIRLFPSEQPKQIFTSVKPGGYATFASTPAAGILHVKK